MSQDVVERLRITAEDDVRGMIRDVSIRPDQFVDEADLRKWAAVMDDAATDIERLKAERDRLRAALAELVAEWRERARVGREIAPMLLERGRDLLEHSADGYDACAGELELASARAEET